MAKTLAKLQARARKTSRKNAVATRAKAKARLKQTFNVSHFRAEDFRADGLRSYAKYRDLGMSTLCSTIPTIARYSKSSYPRSSKP